MPDHRSRQDGAAAGRAAMVRLAAKKGSRFVPLLLLLAMIVMFVSDHVKSISGSEFGAILESNQPLAQKIATFLRSFTVEFLQAFSANFWTVVKGTLYAIGVLSLYALIPGIAGLIYRRSFWRYFLAGFVILYLVGSLLSPEKTGLPGLVGAGQPAAAVVAETKTPASDAGAPASTPGAGGAATGMESVVFFVIAQLALLLLAFRLYRHTSSVGVMPPKIYNLLLAAALAGLAVACYTRFGLGPLWDKLLPNAFYRWEFMLLMLPAIYMLLKRHLSWPSTDPKNIVVCVDGTNNTPGQTELGRTAQTNVLKLFDMLKQDRPQAALMNALVPAKGEFDATMTKRYKNKQMAFYYGGVGNALENSPILDGLGSATGLGAESIVDRAYLDIVRVYRPGDRIFIFGFSRGAAIARLLARTIDQRGAPKKIWSLRLFGRHWPIWKSESKQHHVPVHVLGCWDTVGAFGVAKTIAGIDFNRINAFKDLSIPDNVEQAYHLVALDEQRDSFVPTLMDPDPLTPERIIEVWFSGDHSNVGGSWATDKLSDVTLDFMLSKVSSGYITGETGEPGNEDWGIYLSGVNGRTYKGPLPDAVVALDPDPLGQLRQVTSMLYAYAPRKLPLSAVISETVIQRMTQSEPAYAPQSLFDLNDEIDKKRDAIDEKVARLEETGSLSQTEREEIFKVKNKLRLTRWPKYWQDLKITTALPPQKLSNKKAEDGPQHQSVGEERALASA